MPKTEIDYSNTIFYKIYCKNPDIKDVYIGHTTNFVQRKHAHKRSCTHETSANYNCKVYNVIRKYGGWNNWKMEIIAFCECADHYQARKIEQQYFEEYNATLNSIEPLPKPKTIQPKPIRIKLEKKLLYCDTCNVHFNTKNANDVHVKTNKHIKMVAKANKPPMATDMDNPPSKSFKCDLCDYICSNKKDFNKHLMTRKHQVATNSQQNCPRKSLYKCDCCEKEYQDRTGLWRHAKKCTYTPTTTPSPLPKHENTIIYTQNEPLQHATEVATDKLVVLVKELVLQLAVKDKQHQELIQQNKEFQIAMKEMIPHLGNKKIYKKVLPEIKLDKSVI